ncbi:hypothetical protein ERO13_A06G028600v2 [Gossypium hirsutum]|nr:hypothetical protein ERO13_A06G028600v2 [Gossypium hirsutum]
MKPGKYKHIFSIYSFLLFFFFLNEILKVKEEEQWSIWFINHQSSIINHGHSSSYIEMQWEWIEEVFLLMLL